MIRYMTIPIKQTTYATCLDCGWTKDFVGADIPDGAVEHAVNNRHHLRVECSSWFDIDGQ